MKKLAIVLLCVLLLLCFAGCDAGKPVEGISEDTEAVVEDTGMPGNAVEDAEPTAGTEVDESIEDENTEVAEAIVEYEIGETIIIDGVEFTLTKIEYGSNLSRVLDENYLLPCEIASEHNAYLASEGNVLVSFSYILKNTGKTELDLLRHDWKLDLVYGEGYVFSSEVFDDQWSWFGDKWTSLVPDNRYIAPLSTKEARGYLEVPAEVFENTADPLKVIIHLATETSNQESSDYPIDGRYYVKTTYTYNIR